MKSFSRIALFLAPAAIGISFAFTTPACTGQPEGCQADDDCDGQRCAVDIGECVDCIDSTDCEEGGGCCNGGCIAPSTFENNCGCEAAVGASQGSVCEMSRPICTAADNTRTDGAGLADASCQSPCNPSLGGTISTIDNTESLGYACTCSGADDDGTCNVPFLRADGLPHRGSDLCDPTDKCTCFNGPIGNDGCSALTPDCDANAGCIDLNDDEAHCGRASHSCTDAANGPDDGSGACINGGCTCDQASDCSGDGANTDSCQFVGEGTITQCVCDDFEANGEKAACPLQLACVDGGCELDGEVHATLGDLLDALGLEAMTPVDGPGPDMMDPPADAGMVDAPVDAGTTNPPADAGM